MAVQAAAREAPTRVPQVSLRARRRAWLLVAGLLAMVVCAGAFALVYVGADARVQVLAAARPLAAGQMITAGDLQVVRIVPDAGMALLPRASRVVGRSVGVPVAAGTLLSESQLGPVAWPPGGRRWRRCRSSRAGCRLGWLQVVRCWWSPSRPTRCSTRVHQVGG
jgi:flagella basal body P-ring formation protein FlgA